MRAAGVPCEQISFQIGHRRPNERSTRNDSKYRPDYLSAAAKALEAWVSKILRLAQQKPGTKKVRGSLSLPAFGRK
jgi:hypothetical protein